MVACCRLCVLFITIFTLIFFSNWSLGNADDRLTESGISQLQSSEIEEGDVENVPYSRYVRECAQMLIEHGIDRYGLIHLPVLVTYLDVRTRQCPLYPPREKSYWRGQLRDCFWKPRGSDLFVDQSTIEVFYMLSELTGNERYRKFADRYIRLATEMVDEKGFFWWGWHRFYDVFNDTWAAPNADHHEIHVNLPRWEILWQVNEEATLRELEAIWKWHVFDKETGEHDRHGSGQRGCDFAMSGGEFIYALSFLYSKTKDETYLNGARLVADYHWRSRYPETNLIPNRPNAGKNRFDGCHFDTSITGILCYYLLKSYELVGVEEFREMALSYLRAYAEYGYDKETGKFWGSLLLDGTPDRKERGGEGYAVYEPKGHIDLWEPYQLGYEFPIYTAQVYAYAYQLTGDAAMLDAAKKWAEWIRRRPPSSGCLYAPTSDGYAAVYAKQGTFADMYGRTISFFIHLYALTGDKMYLEDARRIAREAVSKLYYKGLFRGHPAKPYYGSVDGVGYLLYALLQLDRVIDIGEKIVGMKAIPLGKGKETITFDNW